MALLPSGSTAASSVNVGMIASFPSPPYLTELLETAAQENASSYFPILDRVASGHFSQAATDRDLYESFLSLLQEDNRVSSAEALSTFKLALSLRSAAPRIEAHFQYYRTAVEAQVADSPESCDQWILWQGGQYCSPSLDKATATVRNHEAQRKALPFDTKLGDGVDAILYADITSPDFGPFHTFLAAKARKGELAYRLRHVRSASSAGREDSLERLPVSGYGVELALKRTDYIVIDDREAEAAAATTTASADEVVLDGSDEVADLKALSKSELAELGLKAADYIVQSADPLATLLKVTQDFPKYSSAMAAHEVSEAFATEHRANRALLVPSGMNVLWMNGVQLTERQMQAFALVDMIRRERELVNGMRTLGLSGEEAVSVLGHDAVATSKATDTPLRFDWRDELEEGRAIVWLNNLETDARYADFPSNIRALLQGGQRGQIPAVRRNMFHQVYTVDLANEADVQLVTEQLQGFVRRMLPIRFGFVPLTYSKASTRQAKAAYYLFEACGISGLTAYLEQTVRDHTAASGPDARAFAAVLEGHVEAGFKTEDTPLLTLDEVLRSERYEQAIRLAQHWTERLGAGSSTAAPAIFVDGVAMPRDGNWIQAMSARLGQHLRSLQEAVYYGQIGEDDWVAGHFLQGAVTTRNPYIYPDESSVNNKLSVVDVGRLHAEHADLFGDIPVLEAGAEAGPETWAAVTVVADLESDEGVKLLFSALQFGLNNAGVRLDIVHNPSGPRKSTTGPKAVNAALWKQLEQLAGAESWEALKTLITTSEAAAASYVAAVERFRTATTIEAGANAVLLNGRLIQPIKQADDFGPDTFAALLAFEQQKRIEPVYAALADLELGERVLTSALAAAKLTSMVALSTMADEPEGIFEGGPALRTTTFRKWQTDHTSFAIGDETTATIQLTAVVNPASELGQRWTPLLSVLAQLDGVFLRVFLNPANRLDELPVRRFYRAVLAATPTFDEVSGRLAIPRARFDGLPSEALLNLGMDVPAAWLVAPKTSVHDPDNIRLSAVRGDVEATYELEHILIEGHAQEVQTQKGQRPLPPPRGAQLVLTTESGVLGDTIIMANVGYLQFKANPGHYRIQLKPGRSASVFALQSVGAQGMTAVPGDEGDDVALMDFQGTTLYPRLTRRPGMEAEDVLEEGGSSVAEYMAKGIRFAEGILGKKDKNKMKEKKATQADINIFSVASGHLYERMLNIMMVSVMRHTQHSVKFWFIEQFLSPSFREFIPILAAAYGFEYEMVTYKWPHWLRAQREKQREIWGYKILFLDVLFPLSLQKVIFVDADQIVRTDLYDLVTLDLGGAPYGFTPMCDSRVEMEGFRFWKQGYWHSYLSRNSQGPPAPYHISALYVVDLQRFRAIAAGDRLRQTYHTLSADPNSLANLDQDLPNHMQFQIPIFSLPQDWLWCETWCADEALATARTIDLCNNPETKEPKLDRARRQVPEWTVYDDEIAALAKEHRERGGQGGGDRRQGMPMRAADETSELSGDLRGETAGETAAEVGTEPRVRDEL
ncbi:udp-glucose:glycoprotein [Grosmannia clavigera kw1407]|uniref:Udp-glucose:glycoprotein n=1 Tax=Grosmannia clavigera (strain kw1407 / UAMH 11150) TaxID=655863 RepID=F0XRJ5_GROCL|nr:udp-glucose:glycoprotein [Grosmannia clavigera kw1407]EFW99992.1 udp-glucose:glycoprotein [Grosmannia clavigera kw1407]